MIRLIVAFFVCCLVNPGWAQTPSSSPAPATTKPTVKKSAPKAKATQKPSQAAESGPCRIGVIPAIGEKITVQKVGLMVLGNALAEVTASGWGLDDLVVARVRAAAGGNGVRRISFAKDSLASIQNLGLYGSTRSELKNALQQITAGFNCERYVSVASISNRFANTNQEVNGVGVVHWDSIFSRAYVFALTYVRVFDGQTLETIKHGVASVDEHSSLYNSMFKGGPIAGPSRELDVASFPATPPDVLSSAKIRDDARTLLTTSLDKTLPGLLQQ